MKKGTLLSLLLVTLVVFLVGYKEPTKVPVKWHWEHDFTAEEKNRLMDWVLETHEAVKKRIGVYPFTMQVHFYRRDDSSEPVPWANTWRWPGQQLHFHVDTRYSQKEFLEDWTAPHEISHLAIPYLGEKDAWFAEGFASFMQYQVMEEMKILNSEQVLEKYKAKMEMMRSYYQVDETMATRAQELREQKNFPAMYWGGCSLFLKWDARLQQEKGIRFTELFETYLNCCRQKDSNRDDVVASLDQISGTTIGSELIHQYTQMPAKEVM
ncbi:hypothetical protein KFE98_03200 [bacterium SCSIO 12741]|nr:hypothetical protein KFE98_03200 [bacterium SCSIO 12741]